MAFDAAFLTIGQVTSSEEPRLVTEIDVEDLSSLGGFRAPTELSGSDGWHGALPAEAVPAADREGWRAPPETSDSSRSASREERFRQLVAQWKEESRFMSSPMDMVALKSYLEIMALGKPVVPLILQELQREVDHWFCALTVLTGENPVSESCAGDLEQMAAHWLAWGRDRGHIERP